MRRLVGLLAFVAGCDYLFNLDQLNSPSVDATTADGDAELIYMDAPGCFGRYGAGNAGLAQVCLDQAPPDTWTPSGELHTGMFQDLGDCQDKVSQNGTNTDLCLIAARNITIGGYLPTSGNRPIVFVATETFTLLAGATIAADTRRGANRRGAGSNESDCPNTPGGTSSTSGSSGGAGGSFGTKGGSGGKGLGTATGVGAAQPLLDIGIVRGGCKGGLGGGGSGDGGTSGGAVYIIAGKSIEIAGTIDASGEAGDGGVAAISNLLGGDGGGGGGSGGLIGLDSPQISITASASLLANGGGGGGGGAGSTNGTPGQAGKEAQLTMPPSFPAPGGAGGGTAGDGGKGASGAIAPDPGQPAGTSSSGNAGGGGGGGAGFIKFFSSGPIAVMSSNITPPVTP